MTDEKELEQEQKIIRGCNGCRFKYDIWNQEGCDNCKAYEKYEEENLKEIT